MRPVLSVIILLLACSLAYGQVTGYVIHQVFRFQSARPGSAFTVEVDGQQYVITARHLVKPETTVDTKLFFNDAWHSFKASAIYPDNESVDIVALEVGQKVTVGFQLEPRMDDMFLGQQVYFIGYPWDLGSRGSGVSEIPFVKSGIWSAIDSRQKDSIIIYVDGQNNPGFSGGPIVFRNLKTHAFQVAAVISAYRNEAFPVLKKKDLQNPNAEAYEDLYARGNSGIVIGYHIKHIVDAIRRDKIQRKP